MNILKRSAQNTFSGLYHILRWKFGHPARYKRVADAVVQRYGRKVLTGPFAGMVYVDGSAGSAYIPKLIGCYEMEMSHFIHKIIASDYRTIVDIGCAEGYYAVGLALRCPNAQVLAFDGDADAQRLCRQMAEINHVENRVTIDGFCDVERLRRLSLQNALVVCDAEGYEWELLQPDAVPALQLADILVELHEPLRPGVTAAILSRFASTHAINIVDAVKRKVEEHAPVHFLSAKDQPLALTESRPPGQQYVFMTANEEIV